MVRASSVRLANCATRCTSPEPQRVPLALDRTMRTRYKIDSYQQTYFVIDSFKQLFDMTAPDFAPVYDRVKALPELAADATLENETLIPA
jgi:phenylalanine-4-hydroxylase